MTERSVFSITEIYCINSIYCDSFADNLDFNSSLLEGLLLAQMSYSITLISGNVYLIYLFGDMLDMLTLKISVFYQLLK